MENMQIYTNPLALEEDFWLGFMSNWEEVRITKLKLEDLA